MEKGNFIGHNIFSEKKKLVKHDLLWHAAVEGARVESDHYYIKQVE